MKGHEGEGAQNVEKQSSLFALILTQLFSIEIEIKPKK